MMCSFSLIWPVVIHLFLLFVFAFAGSLFGWSLVAWDTCGLGCLEGAAKLDERRRVPSQVANSRCNDSESSDEDESGSEL
jgi:hypothetical protein